MEVVEHVADVSGFLAALGALARPGGALLLGTINRTLRSLALAKIGAEYVLRWVPPGTHDWRRFVRPSELARGLRPQGIEAVDLRGLAFDPLTGLSHGWKDTPRLRQVGASYYAPGRVLRSVDR